MVRTILRRCLPQGTVVRISGSRAGPTAKRMADLKQLPPEFLEESRLLEVV